MPKRCDSCLREYEGALNSCPHCGFIAGGEAREPFFLKPGTAVLGRYAVGDVVGFSSFSILYKAWDRQENRIVALKEYYPSELATRLPDKTAVELISSSRSKEFNSGMERFRKEARDVTVFKGHPNIVQVDGYLDDNNTVYHVMEYLPGKTLREYLKVFPKLSADLGVKLILCVCDAVSALHSAGILHQDIRPDNIIVPPEFPEGDVKLIDFGAAKLPSDQIMIANPHAKVMRPGYSAPEQYVSNGALSGQVDIYALGATLFRILTGAEPEESTNRKITDNVPEPRELNNEIPVQISSAIHKAMAVELHLRFKSVDEFVRALTQKTVLPPQKEMKRRRAKRRASLIMISLAIVAGLTGSVLSIYRGKEAATLPDASLELWYVITADVKTNEYKATAYKAIAAAFMQAYPNVPVAVKGISKTNYRQTVSQAVGRENAPVVLESDLLDGDILSKTLDLSDIARQESKNTYFLDMYTRYFPDKHQLPVGFNATALYINPELSTYGTHGVSRLSELLSTFPEQIAASGIAVNEQSLADFEAAFGGGYSMSGGDAFFSGEAGVYYSSTSEFYAVRERMPARYRILYIDAPAVQAQFEGLWSILPCTGDDQKAAQRLLRFLLSETAQDYLHLRNESGALPLNKAVLDAYTEVYREFEGFFATIDRYSF